MTVLDERRMGVADQMLCANARLVRAVNDTLERETNLTLAWYMALAALAREAGGYLKMSELAGHVALTTSGTTRIVDRIEQAGYVERRDCKNDRRISYCALTPEGREAYTRAVPVYERAVSEYFSSKLSGDELKAFETLVAKLHA